MIKSEKYFRLELTESEHGFVECIIQEYCDENGLELKYYRKMKNGHIPTLREAKVVGDETKMGRFEKFLVDERINKQIVPNEKGL